MTDSRDLGALPATLPLTPPPPDPVTVHANPAPGWLAQGGRICAIYAAGAVLGRVTNQATMYAIMADPSLFISIGGFAVAAVWGFVVRHKLDKRAIRMATWLPDSFAKVK